MILVMVEYSIRGTTRIKPTTLCPVFLKEKGMSIRVIETRMLRMVIGTAKSALSLHDIR